ncbi:helix-turn-helix transcriptional regulator [Sinanaerobacter sp. ZZT-01]|nr:helix-turn-helix transcriptional regulator [Sinanaerobacter sp. ZZT-01]WRR93874.1 helix-turn-helix transcriptional regulator [Sinanaerobacter sp. ZZT-01]
MGVSYNKLFKLMIDKKIRKGELCRAAGISSGSLLKISKDENIYVDILVRICGVLDCDFGDIMEYVPDENSVIKSEPGNRQRPDLQEGEPARVSEEV